MKLLLWVFILAVGVSSTFAGVIVKNKHRRPQVHFSKIKFSDTVLPCKSYPEWKLRTSLIHCSMEDGFGRNVGFLCHDMPNWPHFSPDDDFDCTLWNTDRELLRTLSNIPVPMTPEYNVLDGERKTAEFVPLCGDTNKSEGEISQCGMSGSRLDDVLRQRGHAF